MLLSNIKGKDAIKNIGRVYSAQIFTLIFSLLMSLFVPKILGVEEFSYWQLFLFYASYVGILQFGLNDGIYLRFGGKDLNMKEEMLISNQLNIMILVMAALSVLVILVVSFSQIRGRPKAAVLISVAIYAVTYNITGFCGSILQAANKFKLYSRSIMIEKTFMSIAILVIAIFHINDFRILTGCYIVASIILDALFILNAKNLFFRTLRFSNNIFREIFKNICVGINLMFSNIASALIIGICRFIISEHYPISVFGFVSFALTLCGFCLAFISQIGTAIYPILRKKSSDFHKILFNKVDFLLSNLTPLAFLSYPLLYLIVNSYLPAYKVSLIYFAALIPLCIFEAKISILYGTFMKVLRLERKILYINLLIMLISALFSVIGILIIGNIAIALIGISVCVLAKALLMQRQVVNFWNDSKEQKVWPIDIMITLIYLLLIIIGIQPLISSWIAVFVALLNIYIRRAKIFDAFRFFIIKK